MNNITAFLNDDPRLDEISIEQAEGTVLVEQGVTVLATPCPNSFGWVTIFGG
ncbi:hypothetical protein [Streptomyces sp. NPDC090445]|uniref:hypothetical protein n=1 Tax=Streptomyces sp. NPDC090445 TaxID=3365963 RepID=UPI0038213B37